MLLPTMEEIMKRAHLISYMQTIISMAQSLLLRKGSDMKLQGKP